MKTFPSISFPGEQCFNRAAILLGFSVIAFLLTALLGFDIASPSSAFFLYCAVMSGVWITLFIIAFSSLIRAWRHPSSRILRFSSIGAILMAFIVFASSVLCAIPNGD